MEHIVPQIERDLRAKFAHLLPQWYELVDWSEPLIVGLIAFHTLLFVVVFVTRHHYPLQVGLFVAILMLLFVTERLNTWARANWKLLGTQQYFDQRGVFIGIFYAGPLLALGFFQLMLSMKSMVSMIITVKRAEFKQHLMQKKQHQE